MIMTTYNPSKFVRTILFLVLTFFVFIPVGAAKKVVSPRRVIEKSAEFPDFAYPATVVSTASDSLQISLGGKNYANALRSLLQVVAARQRISPDYAVSSLTLCDSVAEVVSGPYKGLAYLIEANYLKELYSDNSGYYNRRTLPLDSLPENPQFWSKQLFANRIAHLVSNAGDYLSEAKGMSLKELAPFVENWQQAQEAGVDVAGFMRMQGVMVLQPMVDSWLLPTDVIPFYPAADRSADGKKSPVSVALDLLSSVYDSAEESGNTAKRVYLDCWLADRLNAKNISPLTFLLSELNSIGYSGESVPLMYYIFLNSDLSAGYSEYDEEESMTTSCHQEETFVFLGHSFPFTQVPNREDFYQSLLSLKGQASALSSYQPECLNYMLSRLSSEMISLKMTSQYLPGRPVDFSVMSANVNDLWLQVYSAPVSGEPISLKNLKSNKKYSIIDSFPIHLEGEIPFARTDTMSIPPLPEGIYVAFLSKDKNPSNNFFKEKGNDYPVFFMVSSLMVASVDDNIDWRHPARRVLAIDGADGAPVQGANVTVSHRQRNNKPDVVMGKGTTDSSGFFTYYLNDAASKADNDNNYYREVMVKASKGNSYALELFYGNIPTKSEYKNSGMALFTDLSLFHPGDTVLFSGISYKVNDNQRNLVPDQRVRVSLYDPAGESKTSAEFITDADGRISGSLPIPATGVLGMWILEALELRDEDKLQFLGSSYIDVAEYKAPSFIVTAENISSENPSDTISFKGSVTTYSGMPLGGVNVRYSIEWRPFWWRASSGSANYGGKTVTGPDGSYAVNLPIGGLKNTRFSSGVFTFRAVAVSSAGESQESAPVTFILGDGLNVYPSIDDRICVDGDSVRFDVRVLDPTGLPVAREVDYTLYDASGKLLTTGSFNSPRLNLPSSILPSGKYTLKFHVAGYPENCAENGDSESTFIIWRNSDRVPPVETALWVEQTKVVVPSGATTASLRVGNSYKDGNILAVISTSSGQVSYKWIQPKGMITDLEVPAPAASDRVTVSLYSMHDLASASSSVTIVPEAQTEKMEIKAESFRNRIDPGASEHWSFKVNVGGKVAGDVPAMAVLYDKALDALSVNSWNFITSGGYWSMPSNVNYRGYTTSRWTYSQSGPKYKDFQFKFPLILSYMERYYSGGSHKYFMAANENAVSRSMSLSARKMDAVVTEEADVDILGEALVEEMVVANGASVDSDGGNSQSEKLRPVEMPLAFFRPELKADNSGVINIDLEVPDFNTTWKFMLLGYDSSLHSATLTLDAVAARKVMVRSNPPRFLRIGDDAVFSAILFNNSLDLLAVGGRMELFDPLTGKVLLSQEFAAESLAASGSRTVSFSWPVPSDLNLVGFRAYALGGNFSDGEQTIVAILPASSPVIESVPFWLAPGQPEYSVTLPKFGADAMVKLQYCDNPMWYCVTSLPLLKKSSAKDALSIMNSYFGGTVAAGLAGKFPQIREALEALSSEANVDSPLLVSALERDKELKNIALELTPWSADAAAETLRLQRLSSLIDSAANAETSAELFSRLKSLQTPSGGFRWTSDMQPSEYITLRVLYWFGLMRDLDCVEFSSEMTAMCDAAIGYLDSFYVNKWKKEGKNFYAYGMADYLFVRSFFPGHKNTLKDFEALRKKSLSEIEARWKDENIVSKSQMAILLARSGKKELARNILRSISEYSLSSPQKGVWFDTDRNEYSPYTRLQTVASVLRAFCEIAPESDLIRGLKQWLVLSRQTVDWGKDPYMAVVIASLLNSEPRWLESAGKCSVKIGEKEIVPTCSELLTGEFSVELNPLESAGQLLSIAREADSPAWGGVLSRFVRPMKDVKEVSIPQLSVRKNIYVVEEGSSGRQPKKSDLKVGDRVRVTLSIHCDRPMQYVVLTDERPACFEPADQLSGYMATDGVWYDRQVRDSSTELLIPYLPQGDFILSYDCFVDRPGSYSIGIATIQSQYAPSLVAHSSGALLTIKP